MLAGTLREILARLLPVRRLRSNPRVIKRKMSSWHLKRSDHRYWPQPESPPNITVVAAIKTKPNKRTPIQRH
ncbi:hypothetical protein GCM10023322_09620 [Rugosimonospora acidiphila]|uniref:Uncharacterized protein n=1 Tax=Rugosimonospora acidiphila TaxID=556531 RepID=A0ABP9RKJ0_9ACTN